MLYLTLSSIIYNLWDFLCSDCSNLNLIRWLIFEIVSFVAIATDKITILRTKIIKLTWKIILMKLKISARLRHCSEIFKTHVSPLLNHPQGCQGCQKNWKDLRVHTLVGFFANFQLKLHKIWKIPKKHILMILVDFEDILQLLHFWLNISAKRYQGK